MIEDTNISLWDTWGLTTTNYNEVLLDEPTRIQGACCQQVLDWGHHAWLQDDRILPAMVDGWLPNGFEMDQEHDLAYLKEELLAHDAERYQRRIHSVMFFIPMAALASEPFVEIIGKAFQKVSQLIPSLLQESDVFCMRGS